MPKFRKKPVVITAEQWLGPQSSPMEGVFCQPDGRYYCETLEGPLYVSPGDWIITGIRGEKYPCKEDIFYATYEAAEE